MLYIIIAILLFIIVELYIRAGHTVMDALFDILVFIGGGVVIGYVIAEVVLALAVWLV